jgi:cold shock CspA family protein
MTLQRRTRIYVTACAGRPTSVFIILVSFAPINIGNERAFWYRAVVQSDDVFVYISTVERVGLPSLNEKQPDEHGIKSNQRKKSAVNPKVR